MLSMEAVEVETSTCSYEEYDLEVKACQGSTTQISRSSFDFGFQICCWSPEELKAATGSEQQTVVRHEHGVPMHRLRHTDGLFVIQVLDTLDVDVLVRSHGLPSQKWGSNHLVLACGTGGHLPVPLLILPFSLAIVALEHLKADVDTADLNESAIQRELAEDFELIGS
ncbi:unnamed protein product [Sphagnum compactum]